MAQNKPHGRRVAAVVSEDSTEREAVAHRFGTVAEVGLHEARTGRRAKHRADGSGVTPTDLPVFDGPIRGRIARGVA